MVATASDIAAPVIDAPIKTQKAPRDRSIDYLKGFACILMIIAHAPLAFPDSPGAWLLRQFVSPGTAVFFGLAAEAALLQRRRYGLRPVILTYVWLFFLGVNMTPLMQHFGQFDHLVLIEMLTMIAVGCLFVLLLEEYLHPNRWGYLAVSLGIVLLKFAISEFGQKVNWPIFLAVNPGSIEYLVDGSARDYPGFSLIPWLSVFPFVQFLRRSTSLSNLILSVVCSVGVLLLVLTGHVTDLQLDLFNKWDETPAYVLFFGAFNGLLFALFVPGEKVLPFRPAAFVTLGKNSFSFLYAHMFGIFFAGYIAFFLFNDRSLLLQAIPVLSLFRQYFLWIIAAFLSMYFTQLITRIPRLMLFRHMFSWLCLLLLIYLVPLVIPNVVVVWLIEYVLGIILVMHFSMLLETLRCQSQQR